MIFSIDLALKQASELYYSSLAGFYLSPKIWETRDQPEAGFFLRKREKPGNEVDFKLDFLVLHKKYFQNYFANKKIQFENFTGCNTAAHIVKIQAIQYI